MVEMFGVRDETRREKFVRDVRGMWRLFHEYRNELREQGNWEGKNRTQLLMALCELHWQHNPHCQVCKLTPAKSFSHTVSGVAARWGAPAAVLRMAGMFLRRNLFAPQGKGREWIEHPSK
jgi:hypothetical protein